LGAAGARAAEGVGCAGFAAAGAGIDFEGGVWERDLGGTGGLLGEAEASWGFGWAKDCVCDAYGGRLEGDGKSAAGLCEADQVRDAGAGWAGTVDVVPVVAEVAAWGSGSVDSGVAPERCGGLGD